LNYETDGVSLYPTYRKPFDLIFTRAKNEEWSALEDDLRTFLIVGTPGCSSPLYSAKLPTSRYPTLATHAKGYSISGCIQRQ
jgi:hypothetical protein